MKITFMITISGILFVSGASGDSRCQCTYKDWVGDCSASVSLENQWFNITSSALQCSRVDWYIDGEPRVSIVLDGSEKEQWLGKSRSPTIAVQSCKICADSNMPSAGSAEARKCHANDGGRYSGQCHNGVANGQGTLVFKSGNIYTGQFKNGERTGLGTHQWTDGSSYKGGFSNGQMYGQGEYQYPNRIREVGFYQNRRLWNGEIYNPDGSYRCTVQNGFSVGGKCHSALYDGG